MISIFKRCPETGRIVGLNRPKGLGIILFFFVGMASLIWFLVRVIPKPSRINYPCMKATMPVAFSFVIYILSVTGSLLFFRKAITVFRKRQFFIGTVVVCLAIFLGISALVHSRSEIKAVSGPTEKFTDPLGPNVPIGEPKGILPGRVVWIWNPNATYENCTNSSHSDAYWLESNCDQNVVDSMFSEGILSLTGKGTEAEAWDTLFHYFNVNHGKGDIGYVDGETIFIKINAVTAWSGAAPDGEMPSNLGIEFDTSPQTILSLLRQLINDAGVPEENIFVGDPLCDIWNTLYDKFYAEFPNVKYVSKRNIPGRTLLHAGSSAIHYSDHGTVMTEITSHSFYNEMANADYMINIPSLKGHRWAGITLCAKNHFGSNTTDHSWELHKGLMKPDNDPLRDEYNLYRVQVDLMACQYLGGNTMLYIVDGLWSTSYEHQKPQKFRTAPFNNDWCSSVFFSLDPVAIESVCLDIMQKEFTIEDITTNPPRYTYVQWYGIDDYLHQAASSEWWPDDIIYDPDQTGLPIPSLGVHEHWNNVDDMEYSRNLGTGDGIELVKIFHETTVNDINTYTIDLKAGIYPNPSVGYATLSFELPEAIYISVEILSLEGRLLKQAFVGECSAGFNQVALEMDDMTRGTYLCLIKLGEGGRSGIYTQKLIRE